MKANMILTIMFLLIMACLTRSSFATAGSLTTRFLMSGEYRQVRPQTGEIWLVKYNSTNPELFENKPTIEQGDKLLIPPGNSVEITLGTGDKKLIAGPAEVQFITLWGGTDNDTETLSYKMTAFISSLLEKLKTFLKG